MELSKEEIAIIIHYLKDKREVILRSVEFFQKILHDKSLGRRDIIENSSINYHKDIDKINLIISKLEIML